MLAHRRNNNKILIITLAVLLVLAIGIGGFFAWQAFQSKDGAQEKETSSQKVLEAVGGLYILPEEEPTIAKVEDKEKLKDQKFFAQAENGDYVLIFAKSKLALLYREELGKLVNVSSISINDQLEAGSQ